MNLTLTQAFERTKDLAGAIKAARAHEADCAADHAAKQRIADIAGEAHEKATSHSVALEQERAELAEHMAALVLRTGESLSEAEQTAGQAFDAAANIFTQPADFQAVALANGEARINEAYNEATR